MTVNGERALEAVASVKMISKQKEGAAMGRLIPAPDRQT